MPTAVQKSAISFGLVHIPVSLFVATDSKDIKFNQLHAADNGRIRYKKVCSVCGEEVENKEIIKGYEYRKGKYVLMDDSDFELAKKKKDKTLQILQFTDMTGIDPIYYEKAYYALPQPGGEKAFELLRASMEAQNKAAIATTVLGSKEKLLAIFSSGGSLMVHTLFYPAEVREMPEIKGLKAAPMLEGKEMELAATLIAAMDGRFDPSAYKDDYQERLKDIIEQKAEGNEIADVGEEAYPTTNVTDLMDALKQSLKANKAPAPAKGKRKSS